MTNLFNKKAYMFYVAFITVLLVLGGAAITKNKYLSLSNGVINQDKIDYSTEIVGKWQSIDFVKDMSDFKPGHKNSKGDLFIREMNFLQDGRVFHTCFDGKVLHPCFTWTKNIIIDSSDKTASKCIIKNINGSTYMFFEWKDGDYAIRGMKPEYYVLKKISPTPSTTL